MRAGTKRTAARRPRISRVALLSVGCRTNQQEMSLLEHRLAESGCVITSAVENADVVVINTCCVTAHAESKTVRLLHRVASVAPHASIAVTGCLAQQRPHELRTVRNVSWVVGNADKQELPYILTSGKKGVFAAPLLRRPLLEHTGISAPAPGKRTRFLIKIQEGCDHACAYCIVPQVRGPSRSAHPDQILDTCRRAIDLGYKEIVLTGTHIGQYSYEGGLCALLERLLSCGGDFRIRLSSLDPRELSGNLIAMIGGEDRLCDHLHLSLQSLSEPVLKRMNRPYRGFEALLARLAGLRLRCPFAGLGADFITGFPGETDEEFNETLSNAQAIGFSYAHIFRYSPRIGTQAAAMDGAITEKVKKERSTLLREAVAKSRQRFLRRQKGRVCRIIVEKEKPVQGMTSNYLAVMVPASRALHNSWFNVIIEGTSRGRYCAAHQGIAEPI